MAATIKPAAAPLLALLVLLVGSGTAAFPGHATAARKPCWEQVIDDWLDNGTIDSRYRPGCYQAALEHVPEDLRDYTDITDVISIALQAALRPRSASIAVGGGYAHAAGEGSTATAHGVKRGLLGEPNGARRRSIYRRAVDKLGRTSAESPPIPLLVLGGLGGALLLSAAGLAGRKRMKARADHAGQPAADDRAPPDES